MANRNNFITGITEMLILSLLEKGDSYVYQISKSIKDLSDNSLSISQNTLYSATYKLENEGYISEYSKKVGEKNELELLQIRIDIRIDLVSIRDNYQQVVQGVHAILCRLNQE